MEPTTPDFMHVIPEKAYSDMTYEEQIAYTQNAKHMVLHTLLTQNPCGMVSTDKESVEILIKVADSLDKTTIAKQRLKVDAKQAANNGDILQNMTMLIMNAKNRNPFAVAPGENLVGKEPEVQDLPTFAHAAGEEEVGVIGETSDEFQARMTEVYARRQAEEDAANPI